jgi:predicted nucleic acid-binding protein
LTRIADSSFLMAAFDRRDARRGKALEDLSSPETILVPIEVLGETLGVVQRRLGAQVARTLWSDLRTIKHVQFLTTSEIEATAALFVESQKLSWVDAAVVHWCITKDAEPLSFDPEIVRRVKERRRAGG